MESTLNYSVTPLQASQAYIGKWEKSLYVVAQVTLLADTTTQIVCYQSLNKVQEEITTYTTTANEYYTVTIPLNLPYVYFSVRNNSADDQTLLNFSVIYKNISSGGGVSSDVNVTNAQIPVSQSGTWSVDASDSTTHTKLDTIITDLDKFKFNGDNLLVSDSSLYNLLNTKGSSNFIGYLGTDEKTFAINLSSKKVQSITFYGTQDSNANILSVWFSNDGLSWFKSQYSYSFGATSSGDFGFTIQASPKYVCLSVSLNANVEFYADYA